MRNCLLRDSPTQLQQPPCTPNSEEALIWSSAANCRKQEAADRSSGYVICWNGHPSAPLVNPNTTDGNILQYTGWSVAIHVYGIHDSEANKSRFTPS